MTYFLKSGNKFQVSAKEAMDLHEHLPAGNYVVKEAPMDGPLYLEMIDSFEIKGKRYGDLTRNRDRILNTFMDRPATTGVMLTGEKGSGKSLLAKAISMQAAEGGIPTIVINAPWTGDKFNSFIQSIEQPCVILFDEFEKVYPPEEQEAILTLLDGVFPTKKLFVLTCNDKWRVDSHMRNRPGRIYYMMEFKGLDEDFIIEYCEDNLKDDLQEHIPGVCRIASMFDQFNFDMLKALVEEMNRYDETPQDAMKLLNAKPEFSGDQRYKVTLEPISGNLRESGTEKEWHGNPLIQKISIEYQTEDKDSDGEIDINWDCARFAQSDLKHIDSKTGRFSFINSTGDKLVLSKLKEQRQGSYWDAF